MVNEGELYLGDLNRCYRDLFEFELRESIGKTGDIHQSLCMHSAIIAREMAAKGVIVCRVCNTPLNKKGRYNDHLILRHPECVQPICNWCAKENPDKFHQSFKKGCTTMKLTTPLYVDAARWMWDQESSRRFPDINLNHNTTLNNQR